MAGDFDVSDADYAADAKAMYPLRTLTKAQLTALIRAARVANPLHSPVDVEEPPRDAQPARFEHPDP